ncbi:MAG TPA: SAM-dependent methyltransferase [Verrucomicrobiae bacterium]|jgi:tRNA-Thr(GGU) m(6)t(6)A37 methyltransferase TsaA
MKTEAPGNLDLSVVPVGHVECARQTVEDDFWGGAESRIVLSDSMETDALDGIEDFSHAEIIFVFHQVEPGKIVHGARHPRNNSAWPKVGIFAQRGKNRPNRLGSTIARIVRREGKSLIVAELDAVDGTPVLDIKPVMVEFLPRTKVYQPEWSQELMKDYWKRRID